MLNERASVLLENLSRRLDAEPEVVLQVALESVSEKLAPDLHTVPAEVNRIRRLTGEARASSEKPGAA